MEGRPSQAQLGEAFLLMLPVPISGGGHFWLLPALHIARLFDFLPTDTLPQSAGELLSRFEGISNSSEFLIYSPSGCSSQEIKNGDKLVSSIPQNDPGVIELFRVLKNILPSEWGFHDGRPIAIAGFSKVSAILPKALDERTSTALNSSHTAKAQSLRRIQLIPEGAVFVSLLTQNQATGIRVPDRFSIGSDERLGWGCLQVYPIN
jgi:hypothetical protein